MESALLATRALSLSSTDAIGALGGLAAGGVGVDHFDGVLKFVDDVDVGK